MRKDICSKCGAEFKDSRKQKAERGTLMRMLKMIHVAGIQEKDDELNGCCFSCWKTEMRSLMKPYAQALGKTAEDW